MEIDDIKKINAEIKEKFRIEVYTFQIGEDWIITSKNSDIEMEKFENIEKYFFDRLDDIKQKEIEINENSWEEYIQELDSLFEMTRHQMVHTLNIRVPNCEEFRTLVAVLKDKYGDKKVDFFITEIGFTKFYYMLRSSGLFDMMNIVNMINERFNNRTFERYIRILESDNLDQGFFSVRITEDSLSAIRRIAQDIRLTISEFGLIDSIFTLNTAQEEFKGLISDNFKMYYKNDGYIKIIKENIDKIVEKGIIWMANILPVIVEDIKILKEVHVEQLNNDKGYIKELLYKEQGIEEIANMMLDYSIRKNIQICCVKEMLARSIIEEMNNLVIKDQDLSSPTIIIEDLRDPKAKEKFEELKNKGWLAIKEKSIERGESIETFDQDADRILLIPPISIKGKGCG